MKRRSGHRTFVMEGKSGSSGRNTRTRVLDSVTRRQPVKCWCRMCSQHLWICLCQSTQIGFIFKSILHCPNRILSKDFVHFHRRIQDTLSSLNFAEFLPIKIIHCTLKFLTSIIACLFNLCIWLKQKESKRFPFFKVQTKHSDLFTARIQWRSCCVALGQQD